MRGTKFVFTIHKPTTQFDYQIELADRRDDQR